MVYSLGFCFALSVILLSRVVDANTNVWQGRTFKLNMDLKIICVRIEYKKKGRKGKQQ